MDGSKFHAVNADNKAYTAGNARKFLLDVEEKIGQYRKELDDADAAEAKPGALTKEDITGVLEYLERRKKRLAESLAQMEDSGENQICTTDPECRLMKTRDGIRPSFNVQTAVETDNYLIVDYEVTNECVDWNLLESGINGTKAALGVENLEGIANRGYGSSDEVLACLLNGDTPTMHPNKGETCRIFRFENTDVEITREMLSSKEKNTLLKCISAGVLPEVLQRDDAGLEVVKRREQGSRLYLDKETGELVSYAERKARGGLDTAPVEVKREPPVQPNGKKDSTIRRYHRLSACSKCPNKRALGKRRIISFQEGETRRNENFYDKARGNKIVQRTNHRFKSIALSEEEGAWEERVIPRFYANQQRLRKRNTVVEHPYGTVKR